MNSLRWIAAAVVAALGIATVAAQAQELGTVSGRVLEGITGRPIPAAQVALVGANIATLTRADGRYALVNVPPGPQEVRVRVIGYATITRSVTVLAGGEVSLDFGLEEAAVTLDEVVVTGTPGGVERRALGNDLSRITSNQIESAPIATVGDVLQGRATGVTVMDNSGQVGAGNTIRLRGISSFSQGNTPLIYVDGVRMTNVPYAEADEAAQSGSPLNDINPQDIERVEVVKGAAATTLYGTEAAGGVIQVFTKRGSSGAPLWSLTLDHGFHNMGHVGPKEDPTGLGLNDCSAAPGCPASGSWFRNGRIQRYNLSVRGGAEQLNYFVSAKWGDEQGVIAPQGSTDWAVRGNFGFTVSPKLLVTFSNNYARRNTRWIPDGNNREGFLINVIRGTAGYTPGNDDSPLLDMRLQQRTNHFTSAMTVSWTPSSAMTHRVHAGIDYAISDYEETHPWGFVLAPDGSREDDQYQARTLTLDYSGTWTHALGTELSSSFSWGGQLYDEFIGRLDGFGDTFAGPGDKVVQSGAITEAFETKIRVASGGFFLQELLGWKDQLYFTVGLRVDGHSSFGNDFGLAPYPKVSAAYVLSEADFWPDWWEAMKVRIAYGESGKAPGPLDRLRTWAEVSGDEGQPAVTPANVGDPNLGPERTREIEAGFEGSMFNGRVGVNFTYYRQRTYDALIAIQQVPSEGFIETQLLNVGSLENRGTEASVNVQAVRRPGFAWDVGLRYSTNRSEALSLGGIQDIYIAWRQHLRAGYPVPSYFHDVVTNPDEVGVDPIFEERYLGPSYPTRTWGISTSLTVGSRLTLDVLGEGQGGHVLSSGTAYQNVRREVWPECADIVAAIDAGNTATLTAYQRAKCDPDFVTYGMWIEPADFFKLRSLSLSYRVPERLLPFQVRGATIRLQARNLFTITDFPGLDPEAFDQGSTDALFRQEYYDLPPSRQFLASLRLDF